MQPPCGAVGMFAEIKRIEFREAGVSRHGRLRSMRILAHGTELANAAMAAPSWPDEFSFHSYPARLAVFCGRRADLFPHPGPYGDADQRLWLQRRLPRCLGGH